MKQKRYQDLTFSSQFTWWKAILSLSHKSKEWKCCCQGKTTCSVGKIWKLDFYMNRERCQGNVRQQVTVGSAFFTGILLSRVRQCGLQLILNAFWGVCHVLMRHSWQSKGHTWGPFYFINTCYNLSRRDSDSYKLLKHTFSCVFSPLLFFSFFYIQNIKTGKLYKFYWGHGEI